MDLLKVIDNKIQSMKISRYLLLSIGVILAIVIRYSLLNFESGDYAGWLSPWYDFIVSHGRFKALKHNFSNYAPAYLYLLVMSVFLPIPKLYAIKLISIIFDILLAIFVFLIVRIKYKEELAPLLSFVVILLTPTVILNSSAWAQCDAIYTTALVASVYFLLKERTLLAFIFYSLSLSLKPQAIFILPLLLILAIKKEVPLSYFIAIPITYIISILPVVALGRPFYDALFIYLKHASAYGSLEANAPNIYRWFSNDYYSILYPAGNILTLILVCFTCLLFYKTDRKIDKDIMIKLSFFLVILIPCVMPKMHDRYFYPADIFSIIYAFYFPKYFYMPIGIQLASLSAYSSFLWRIAPLDLSYSAIIILVILIIVGVDLFKSWHSTAKGS